ncbi:MAG: hypothetical protein AAF661_04905 [Pseudomonadota bacterium]
MSQLPLVLWITEDLIKDLPQEENRHADLGEAGWRIAYYHGDALTAELDGAKVSNDALRAENAKLKEAATWVLNVESGVGKSGNPPDDDERTAALESLRTALNSDDGGAS